MKKTDIERCCIVSRNIKSKNQMLRFVLDPNDNVIIDIKGNLPGKGMWVDCNKSIISKAVKGNIFSKSAKKTVKVDSELVELCEKLLTKKVMDTISLARRTGSAINGFEKVKELLKSGDCHMVFCATDDSDGMEKLSGMCRMLELPFYNELSSDLLSKIFANENVIYTGIKKCGISDVLNIEAERLKMFCKG